MSELTDIRTIQLDQLSEWIESIGEKKFRAKQIWQWIWQKHAISFEEMTNISLDLRQKLSEQYCFRPIQLDVSQHSSDGTIKCRFQLHDGAMIESVLIPVPDQDRYTVCVSSQVGCSLACKFCATGQMKRFRNLTSAEIFDQYVIVNEIAEKEYQHPLTNVVYMGMGEPLLNFKETTNSILHLTQPYGLNISPKRITISTAGIAKMIQKLADLDLGINLALSLHAADDTKRNEIMPINESNHLEVLMDALNYFYQNTQAKISYEYIAFQDFNDSLEDAKNLSNLSQQFPVTVNIIEYNPIPGVFYEKSTKDKLDLFAQYLRKKNVMVTIRRSRGKDIDAACGQLANQ